MDNGDNVITLDSTTSERTKFSGKFWALLIVAILITFGLSIFAITYLTVGIKEQWWQEQSMNGYLANCLFLVNMLVCFISLVIIAISRKPFSNVLIKCIYIIGIIFVMASFWFPHIPGYQRSGFRLLDLSENIVFEGATSTIGIMFLLFGRIMKYGLEYQKEIDTLL